MFPIGIGDSVTFERIDAATFDRLEAEAEGGRDLLSLLDGAALSILVERIGPGATIQDGGRHGWLRFGVTPAGAMDWAALQTANLALGNAPDAAAIEIASGEITLAVTRPTTFAFAGGGFAWRLDETRLPAAARIKLEPGERLVARAGASGAFTICAVAGCIDVPPIMGSRATHMRSALGGLEGRALRAGDTLECGAKGGSMDDRVIDAPWLERTDAPIRVVLGPQDDGFQPSAIQVLTEADYTLTPAADRMAYKFSGPVLAHARDFNIVSDGVALGAIQVAGDGQPLVLMADRQPTGGYAKIGHVCRADIGRLAQLRPGESCRFALVNVEAARDALLALEDEIATTADRMTPLHRPPTAAALFGANLIGGVVDGRD